MDDGGNGGVGQFTRAGLKTEGDGVGAAVDGVPAKAVGVGPVLVLVLVLWLGDGFAVGDGVGVST